MVICGSSRCPLGNPGSRNPCPASASKYASRRRTAPTTRVPAGVRGARRNEPAPRRVTGVGLQPPHRARVGTTRYRPCGRCCAPYMTSVIRVCRQDLRRVRPESADTPAFVQAEPQLPLVTAQPLTGHRLQRLDRRPAYHAPTPGCQKSRDPRREPRTFRTAIALDSGCTVWRYATGADFEIHWSGNFADLANHSGHRLDERFMIGS